MTPGRDLVLATQPGLPAVRPNGRESAGRESAGRRRASRPRASGDKAKAKVTVKKKLSRLRKPDDMSLEAWQIALRQEFGRKQKFRLKNLGKEPIFSEFEVTNPQTKRTYRVAIRGRQLGDNFCSCPDFAVNTLGTCKHIEFTLARLGRTADARRKLAAGCQPPYSEVYVRYGAKREVVFRPGSNCPAELARRARPYFDAEGRLLPDAYLQFHAFLKHASTAEHELRCYDDALAMIAQVRDRARLAAEIDREFPRGIRSAAFNKLLSVSLYPYQREGALFAAKAGRCLIADDMGLGKTIQAIAAAEILARTVGLQRVLIVAPTSLKHQWRREIEKFSGRESVVVEGLLARRAELYAAEGFYKITNYDVIHRDLDRIRRWQPDLVILDEAQRIKNWKTRTAQSVKRLESKFALVLTGTPLENRLEELHSIVEFVDRFRLGPMFRFLAEHQHVDENGRVVGYRNLSKISQTIAPMLIRRTKDKVLKDLPERLEKRFFVPMTPQQKKHHDENRETVARLVQKWRRYGFLNEADQLRMRIALQNMRMACNSTYLLDKKTDYGVKADELIDLLAEVFEDEQSKVVIFSQWVRMHELVVRRLERRKWQHVLFHGGVPGPKRKDLVRVFKEDPACRLFLSTDAGGVGLNLQHASVVVNLDQPWNPAVLEQRIGRVHRLGQHRPVRVVHFISQGTIEEGMLSLLAFKKSMFTGVLDDGQDEVFMGGTRLKRFIESVEKATTTIPQAMPLETTAEGEQRRADGQGQLAPSEYTGGRRTNGEPEALASGSKGPPAAEDRRRGAEASPAESRRARQEEAWAEVLTAGMSLVEKLTRALAPGKMAEGGEAQRGMAIARSLSAGMLADDEQTGQPCLKIPLPPPETIQEIAQLLGTLVGGQS
jgi:superfamily II DNA or RNA helicase